MKQLNKSSELIFSKHVINYIIITAFIFSFSVGCKKEEVTQALPASQVSDIKANMIVHSGESIQAAVDAAQPGWVIKIEPGIYNESITVNKAGIKLIGVDKNDKDLDDDAGVIIQNPGEEENGIKVSDAGDGFMLKNITVKNFEENGVLLISVDNFTISHVTAVDNGEYGIFPVHCSHGVIKHCKASGHSDTGIYVGQSSDVNIEYNTATENVNGLEIENSSDINVTKNQSYDNVCGIFIDLLPDKDIKTSTNVYIANNHVYNNNHVNFGDTDELEATIPTGIGILVLGTDQTLVENNTVTGNGFTGIVVFSTLVLSVIADVPPEDILADIEPNPDGDKISSNNLHNNGFNPPVIPGLPLPGVDLLWDGSGTNNCWSKNIFTTSAPSPLPSCN
jgi:parallel beta-helix repeat protein